MGEMNKALHKTPIKGRVGKLKKTHKTQSRIWNFVYSESRITRRTYQSKPKSITF